MDTRHRRRTPGPPARPLPEGTTGPGTGQAEPPGALRCRSAASASEEPEGGPSRRLHRLAPRTATGRLDPEPPSSSVLLPTDRRPWLLSAHGCAPLAVYSQRHSVPPAPPVTKPGRHNPGQMHDTHEAQGSGPRPQMRQRQSSASERVGSAGPEAGRTSLCLRGHAGPGAAQRAGTPRECPLPFGL